MNRSYSLSLLLSLLVVTSASFAMDTGSHGMKREELPPDPPLLSPNTIPYSKKILVKVALPPKGHKREDLPPYEQPYTQKRSSHYSSPAWVDEPRMNIMR